MEQFFAHPEKDPMLSWMKRFASVSTTSASVGVLILPLFLSAAARAGGPTHVDLLTDQKADRQAKKADIAEKRRQVQADQAKNQRCLDNPDASGCAAAAPATCDCWPSSSGGACGMAEWIGHECDVYQNKVLGDRFLTDATDNGALLFFDGVGRTPEASLDPAEQKWKKCFGDREHKQVTSLPSREYYFSLDLRQTERREACNMLNKRSGDIAQDNPGCMKAVRTCLTVKTATSDDVYKDKLAQLDEEDKSVDGDIKNINDQLIVYMNCPTCNRSNSSTFGETLVGVVSALAPVAQSAIGLMGYSKYANTQSQMYGQYINNAYLAYQDQAQEYTQLGLPIGSFSANAPGISPYGAGGAFGAYGAGGYGAGGYGLGYGSGLGGLGGMNNGLGGVGGNLNGGFGVNIGTGINGGGVGLNVGLGGGLGAGGIPGAYNGMYAGGYPNGQLSGAFNGGAIGAYPNGAYGSGAYPYGSYGANPYGATGAYGAGYGAGYGGVNGIPGYINGNVTTGIGPITGQYGAYGGYGTNPYGSIYGANPQYGYGAAGGGYYDPSYQLQQQQQQRAVYDYGTYQQQLAQTYARGQQIQQQYYGAGAGAYGAGYGNYNAGYGAYGAATSPYGAYGASGSGVSAGLYVNGYLGLATGGAQNYYSGGYGGTAYPGVGTGTTGGAF